jgi:hypothetical protein
VLDRIDAFADQLACLVPQLARFRERDITQRP